MKLISVNRNERNLLIFTSFSHAISDAWYILYPSLIFLIALDFNENYLFLGILANVTLSAGGISGVISGILSDRFSSKLMFSAFSILSALGALLVFTSHGGLMLTIALFILGVGTGIYHPVGLSAITRNIRRRTEALGVHGMVGGIAISLLPVTVVTLGINFGWRYSFLFASAISLTVLVFLPLVPRKFDKPQKESVTPQSVIATFSSRRLLGIYAASILRQFAMTGFLTFLATAVATTGGLGQTQIGIISITGLFTTIILASGAVGSYLGGKLGAYFNLERTFTVLTLAIVPLLLILGATKGMMFLALAPFIALTLNSGDPILGSLIGKYLPNTMHGKGFAVLFGIGQIVGSLGGFIAGITVQQYGINWVFPVSALFPLMALPILRLTLWPKKKT